MYAVGAVGVVGAGPGADPWLVAFVIVGPLAAVVAAGPGVGRLGRLRVALHPQTEGRPLWHGGGRRNGHDADNGDQGGRQH